MSSLLLGHPPKLCLRKPVLVRASPLLSNGTSSSSVQTPPCYIIDAKQCGANVGKLTIRKANEREITSLDKKVPMDLVYNYLNDEMVTIGSSHGWVATLRGDGILRLQDDLNPFASDSDPKRISLPPLVTLPDCQTQIITNVSMSAPSPEEEDCIVAVKFLGPQLSFCRPAAQCNPEWINIRIDNPCFFSSPVMFSKKDDMFCILGSGGHLIGSWDLRKDKHTPKLQKLQFQNLPELNETTREVLSSCCCTSEHLVESTCTGETFLVKQYTKTAEIVDGIARMKTEAVMVFKLDEEGNAVYTQDIGDRSIFLSKSEPFCVPTSCFPGMFGNKVYIFDFDEVGLVSLSKDHYVAGGIVPIPFGAPYFIPPQNFVKVPMDSVYNDLNDEMVTIGSSNGYVATLKDDGILRLQDDLHRFASGSPKRIISLPPLVTLPDCQTQIITNVSMSAPSPVDEDCIVAVKFLGPQLSFCRPAAQCNPEWTNIRIDNPCFFSSPVMFSKKDDMFCILGSGGHLIGSWDLRKHKHTPKLQKLQFQNLPELNETTREVLSSCCCTSEHLVESDCTGETFLVKQYRKTAEMVDGIAKMKIEAVMVFKLDEEGNAVYTQDIGDLYIYLTKSEPFCVPTSSLPDTYRNKVYIFDADEHGIFDLSKDQFIPILD